MPPSPQDGDRNRNNTKRAAPAGDAPSARQAPPRHTPAGRGTTSLLLRLCAGLVAAGSLVIGSWRTGQALLPVPANTTTGRAILLLGSCLFGLAGLTVCLGTGKDMTMKQVAARYRALHGWIGITTGSLLATGFLAGTVTLFAGPLQQWSTPPLPRQTLAPTSTALPLSLLPSSPGGGNGAGSPGHHLPPASRYRLILAGNTATARLSLTEGPELPLGLPAPQLIPCQPVPSARCAYRLLPSPVPAFTGGLHRRLGLPVPESRAMPFIGLLCLLYGLVLLSGVILLLPGLWRSLMTVRLQGHARRLWLDLHSLLGFCTLPFHLVIALTTALCAFAPLLPASTPVGTVPAAPSSITTPVPPGPSGIRTSFRQGGQPRSAHPENAGTTGPAMPATPLLPPTDILSRLHSLSPGFQPLMLDYIPAPHVPDSQSLHVTLHAPLYDAEEAAMSLAATRPYLLVSGRDHLAPLIGRDRADALFDPHDGRLLSGRNLPDRQSPARRLLTWCMALHFGSFGGEFVRWLYVTLGLCGVGFFHTANQLWLNSHRRKQAGQPRPVETPATFWLGRLSEGSLLGCLLGLCVLILLSPFMVHLHHLPGLAGQAATSRSNPAPVMPSPVMTEAWWHTGFIYYGIVTCVITGRCLLPPRLCRGLVCLLSAMCLSTALILAAFRHAITQSSATLSLSSALTLASLALWGAGFSLLHHRGHKRQPS